jgi:hypothetical protein
MSISNTINKLKFDLEREEKETMRKQSKLEEHKYIEYQKEQVLKN